MKRIGQVPSETLEDNIKLIEESKKTKAELIQVQEQNAILTKEVEQTKSTETEVLYYQRKYQEIKVEKEKQITEKTAEISVVKSERDYVQLKFDQSQLEKEELMKQLAQVESMLAKLDIKSK